MRNLIILCRRQESPKTRKKMQQSLSQDESSKATNDKVKVDLSIPDEQLLLRSTFYCPFCRCDEEAGPLKRNKLFARIDGLRRHVRVQHLEYKRPNEGFICPYQGCITPLKGTMHFLNHTALEHGLCLWPASFYLILFFVLLSFVILVILSFGVRRGKDSNLLAEKCFHLISSPLRDSYK